MNNGIPRDLRLPESQPWSNHGETFCVTEDISVSGPYQAMTTSGTANTWTPWVEYEASTPYDSCIINLEFFFAAPAISGNNTTVIDIGIGAAESEIVLIPKLAFYGTAGPHNIWIPLRIPAGSRLSIRMMSARTSLVHNVGISLTRDILDFPSGSSMVCIHDVDVNGYPTTNQSANTLSNQWKHLGAWTGKLLWLIGAYSVINHTVLNTFISWGSLGVTRNEFNGTPTVLTGYLPDSIIINDLWTRQTNGETNNCIHPIAYLEPPLESGTIMWANRNIDNILYPLAWGISI